MLGKTQIPDRRADEADGQDEAGGDPGLSPMFVGAIDNVVAGARKLYAASHTQSFSTAGDVMPYLNLSFELWNRAARLSVSNLGQFAGELKASASRERMVGEQLKQQQTMSEQAAYAMSQPKMAAYSSTPTTGAGTGSIAPPSIDQLTELEKFGVTADLLDGAAALMRQRDRIKAATPADLFCRGVEKTATIITAEQTLDLERDGWEAGGWADGGEAGPQKGWGIHWGAPSRRWTKEGVNHVNYELGDSRVGLTYDGAHFCSGLVKDTPTYKRHGNQAWEKQFFDGLQAFARNADHFKHPTGDKMMSRVAMEDALHGLARIVVEVMLLETPPTGYSGLLNKLRHDPFGRLVYDVFNGPMQANPA